MKSLVTGGAGFIGSHLCRALLNKGENVTAVDNLFTGSEDNIADLLDDPRFSLIRHDITVPPAEVPEIMPVFEAADRIYNLACPASPIHYQEDPVKTVETNVMGADNMLRIAEQTGARILQASTSEVYGDPDVHPQTEDYWGNVNPIGPRSCYDEGKRVAETLMFDYHRERGVDIRVVRIFNTYGPSMSMNDGRVVSNFIVQALMNENITVYGEGDQTRSFCYVDDMVRGIISMMDCSGFTGPVNLGNPDERSIRELAELIISLTGSSSDLVRKPLPENDPVRRKPDITLAGEKLTWSPEIPLETGLERTIEFFKTVI